VQLQSLGQRLARRRRPNCLQFKNAPLRRLVPDLLLRRSILEEATQRQNF
jgi:hypothetical protein